MSRGLAFLLSFALAAALPTGAAARAPAKSEAQAHFEAAAELYAREDYAAAAREFAIAYALDARVDILFAWAQAERQAANYAEAVELYERLLAGELSDKQRAAIEELLVEVRAAVEAEAPADIEPEPEPAPAQTDADDSRPAKPDTLALALTGIGAGLALVGGGLLIGGASADARVRKAESYQAFADAYDPSSGRGRGAVTLYASGAVLAGVGVTALLVGAVRLARGTSPEPKTARVRMGPWIGPASAGLSLRLELPIGGAP